jgi:hypothetical protein
MSVNALYFPGRITLGYATAKPRRRSRARMRRAS